MATLSQVGAGFIAPLLYFQALPDAPVNLPTHAPESIVHVAIAGAISAGVQVLLKLVDTWIKKAPERKRRRAIKRREKTEAKAA